MDDIMDMELELEDFIISPYSIEKFDSDINELSSLYEDTEFVMEALDDPAVGAKNVLKKGIKETKKTVKNGVSIYDNLTTAGGTLIKLKNTIIGKAIHLASSCLVVITNLIAKIPVAIVKLVKKISVLPSNLVHKIKGDILLYITAKDISTMYTESIVARIDNFIDDLAILREGEMWGTMFRKRRGGSQRKTNDMKLCQRMTSEFRYIEAVQFTKTAVKMDKPETIECYFGTKKCIKFTDKRGHVHEWSYYEGLEALLQDLTDRQSTIKNLQEDFGTKMETTELNQSYQNLPKSSQELLSRVIQQVSKVVSIISKVLKCVTEDMKTITNSVEKVQKAAEKRAKKKERRNKKNNTEENTEDEEESTEEE